MAKPKPPRRIKLDDRFARTVAPPTDGSPYQMHYDSLCIRLALRVMKAGFKSFVLNYRTRAGKERRYTIGSFPDWNCAQARTEAQRLKRLVDQGRDPQAERRAERHAATMTDLCSKFLAECAPTRHMPKTQVEYARLIKREILPGLGSNRKVADVTFADCQRLHRKISLRAPPLANRVKDCLTTIFGFAIQEGMRPDNPAEGVWRNREGKRVVYLTPTQRARFSASLMTFAEPNAQVVVLWVLLFTGAWRGEVSGACWSEFDLGAGIWTKPPKRGGEPHRIPLSTPLRQILQRWRQVSATTCPFVFPAKTKSGHVEYLSRPWSKIRDQAGLPRDFRLHDLRRDFRELAGRCGGEPAQIARLVKRPADANSSHADIEKLRPLVEAIGATIVTAVFPMDVAAE
jgi:integrase